MMQKEQVIVHREYFERLGQIKYFQIDLPRDTERIVGVEAGAFREGSGVTQSGLYAFLGSGPFSPPDSSTDPIQPLHRVELVETIGRLTLQSPETTDVFFQGEVRQRNLAQKFADFTQYTMLFDQWSHDKKRIETDVKVKGCSPIIEGHYRDMWGRFTNCHVQYFLHIYIWIEKKI